MEKHNTDNFDSSEEDLKSHDDQLLCGFGGSVTVILGEINEFRCTPRWLQKLHNAKMMLLVLGICAFIQVRGRELKRKGWPGD